MGAGPGDPGLLTIRGVEVLKRAEVVIYDYLANEEFLRYAPPEAERIYVGKKGGDHTLSQDAINRLLVEKGRTRTVVRLKGGDPFVFGRGGEEAEDLVRAGIPFEVVPGVTAAVAVPAYAGIPLSHRDFTTSMTFVTGHERGDKGASRIAWKELAGGKGTLVFFMGVKNLSEIRGNLLANGCSPETPAAVIRWGTTVRQKTIVGTLADIAEKVLEAGLTPPAVIVVGEVVRLRDRLNWFESRPLFGRRIVVTRAREQASDFKALLMELGAECIEFPMIQIAPPPSWEPLDSAIARVSSYEWIIFTSVNGVRFFMERLRASGGDVRKLKDALLAAIGPRTAEALEKHGLRPDLVPSEYRAEAIMEALPKDGLEGLRFLIPRAMIARDVLPDSLRKAGALVDVVPAYQTVMPPGKSAEILALFGEGAVDCLTFTSSSTVDNFFAMFQEEELRARLGRATTACIGPITAETAQKHGLSVDIMPREYTIPALASAIASHFAETRGER